MLLDPQTLMVSMLLVILLTSSSYMIVWLQDRRETSLLWMTAAALFGAVFFATRVLLPTTAAIIVANCGVLTGIGCVWTACRLLRGRAPVFWALPIPAIVWIGLCLIPGFLAHTETRIAAGNFGSAVLFGLALRELWLMEGQYTARWWVFGVQAAQWTGSTGRMLAALILPDTPQTDFELLRGFAFMALSVMGFMLLMSFGIIALVKERSDRRYKQVAAMDALTGLGNRRHFDESLDLAMRQAWQARRPLAIVMIDVDSFKAYNDLYGHPQGDVCLRTIAVTLQSGLVRPGDLVLRYGGEEFAVLLPDTDAAAAVRVAERLRLAVRALGLRHGGREDGVVTISLGVAATEPAYAHQSGAALLEAADQALYRAKRLGRNRTICNGDDEADGMPAPRLRLVADTPLRERPPRQPDGEGSALLRAVPAFTAPTDAGRRVPDDIA